LARRPAEARETLSAEIAHAVDYGLPMTAGHRTALMHLVHRGATDDHTWWEREGYDEEYYTLVGEAWMAMFTHAYSRIEPWQGGFKHKSSRAIAPAVRRILEIAPAGVKASPVRLKARTWRTDFGNAYAELNWTGAQGKRVSVWRDGARLGAAQNDGRFIDFLGGRRGAFSYLVLDAKGQVSNERTVKV
jgi:hypothetical protein